MIDLLVWGTIFLIWLLMYRGYRIQKDAMMTSVPPRPPIPEGRGKRADTRTYTWMEWTKGYLALVLLMPLYVCFWFLANVVRTLPPAVTRKLLRWHTGFLASRPMDFRIPPSTSVPAYMHRWWRLPRNAFFNIYYHVILRSDDDRAHHDHPWFNFSIVLKGGYWEHTTLKGGVITRKWFGPGSMQFRWWGTKAHRLELENICGDPALDFPATTIFITGPVLRRWGFHDGLRGWIDAYDWDRHCETYGISAMRMDGGSDAVVSDRNKIDPKHYQKD